MTEPSTEARLFKRWRWAILVSTWMSYAGFYFCRKTFWAVKGPMGKEMGFDEDLLSDIGVIYLVTYTIGQFVAAGIGQRTGARILLLVGMAISIAANIVFGFSHNFWTFAAFMALNGFAQATGWSACMGTIGNWTTRAERGTLMGFWATCYQLGGWMATSWAGLWIGLGGWRGSFFAGSAVLSLVWVVVWFNQRNQPSDVGLQPVKDAAPPDNELANAQVAPADEGGWTRSAAITVALVGLTYFGIKFIRYTIWSWAPYLLNANFGLDGNPAAQFSTIFDVAGFLGTITAGYVSDRLFKGRRAKLSFFMLIGLAGGCTMMYLLGTHSLLWFGISMGVVGFMLFGPDSLLSGAGAIEIGSRRTAIAAAGIINGVGSAGAVAQEKVVAWLYNGPEKSVAPVFAALIVAALLSLAGLAVVLWRNRTGASDL